jgi:uncharacterized membrane protein
MILMFLGVRYGYGLWFLLPVLLVLVLFGHFFWIVIPLLFIGLCVLPRFGFRNRWMPAHDYAYQPGTPAQPSALDVLNQRYARGEIDALTYEQMRERLSDADRPRD